MKDLRLLDAANEEMNVHLSMPNAYFRILKLATEGDVTGDNIHAKLISRIFCPYMSEDSMEFKHTTSSSSTPFDTT
ncbi:hypothetical protein Nepgr_001874 [Nepenthes gracilis]|uniref:Uncharacterized protein n=1 Tax=Nepenthes gracilis TaxID=150966 RepID=A0AAD3RY32_NEPGR|nr:hypothetical protein Nepgr_001874 [Nepenthes gracilis]